MSYVIDSSAILAYLLDEKEATTVKRILRAESEILLSVVQYGEVLYTCERERKDIGVIHEFLHSAPFRIIAADEHQTAIAAHYKTQGGIAYPDCFALVLAKLSNATLLTKDREFKKFARRVKIRWLK